jgi:hypothetical protein
VRNAKGYSHGLISQYLSPRGTNLIFLNSETVFWLTQKFGAKVVFGQMHEHDCQHGDNHLEGKFQGYPGSAR